MADGVMSTQHGRMLGQYCSNCLPDSAMHQSQSFPRNPLALDHRSESSLEYQLRDSRSDYTRSCNSSIFSSNRSRLSQFSSMSSLQSSLESSFQPRERPTECQFFCPICIQFDDQPIVYMKRKGEMKSHIQRHLFSNELLHCDHCPTARDRFEDLKTHCKRVHGSSLRSKNMVGKIEQLLPQERFACGFLDWTGSSYCREVRTNYRHWLDHIAEHMEGGSIPAEWSYSAVIKNLLRQPELGQLWKDYRYMCEGRDKRVWTPLAWDVDRSRTLMLKLNRRDFRPAVNNLLAWAYELGLPEGLPAGQPADHNANLLHKIPTLKPPTWNDLQGLSTMEIDTVLKRHSKISRDMRELPASHDSITMSPIEPVLEFITGDLSDIPPMPFQPESNSEPWPNLQLASSLQGNSGHNSSLFTPNPALHQPQPFHQGPNLPLNTSQPPDEARGPMGPDSHLLENDTHNPTDFDYTMFDVSTDYHGTAP